MTSHFYKKTRELLIHFMNEFYRIIAKINMPVAVEKTLGSTQILEYLGLLLDFINQTIGIPEKKRLKSLELIESLLTAHRQHRTVIVKQL